MIAKTGFLIRNIAGEYLLMPTDEVSSKIKGAILLNRVSAFVWEKLQNPVSAEELLKDLLDHFNVTEETAKKDLTVLLDQFRDLELIEDGILTEDDT